MSEQHERIARWLAKASEVGLHGWHCQLNHRDASDLLDEWEDAQATIARQGNELRAVQDALDWLMRSAVRAQQLRPSPPAWTVIA